MIKYAFYLLVFMSTSLFTMEQPHNSAPGLLVLAELVSRDALKKSSKDARKEMGEIRFVTVKQPNERYKYYCFLCDKTICNKKMHLLFHSREKPYTCDICGKAFRQSGHLTGHKKTH